MNQARIADSKAREVFAVWADDVISAVRKEEDMAAEVAYIDGVIAEVDRELETQERTEEVRVLHKYADIRTARRAHRRAEASVLRALPSRIGTAVELGGEAA